MRQKIVVTAVVLLAGILLVLYTNAATGGWAEATMTPTATRINLPSATKALTATSNTLQHPSPTITATGTLFTLTATQSMNVSPSATITPNYAPPITGTPVPPLTAHVWQSGPIVVQMETLSNEPMYSYPFPLVIYSDGRVFQIKPAQSAGLDIYQISTMQLNRVELCSLLNTLDHYGFFDYDSNSYYENQEISQIGTDANYTNIEVNAWRSQRINLPGLSYYADKQKAGYASGPTFLPALWNTYELLRRYPFTPLQVYEPNRLAVWVVKQREGQPEDRKWPPNVPSLKELYSRTRPTESALRLGEAVILTDQSAKTIAKAFDHSINYNGLWFVEGSYAYQVVARPLLPYQAASGIIPDPSISITPTTLSCQPSDGVLAMPQP